MNGKLIDRFSSAEARERVECAIAELRVLLGDRLSQGQSVREHHGRGESLHLGLPPDAVVWPESKDEVRAILATCSRFVVPVIPFGAGTSLEGHVSAPYGGICLDMSRMNRVVTVHAQDADCVVEPGVTREALNDYLRDTGLFFPLDPGANATIGGMASTRASGTTTVRYGTMAQNVMALEIALADGRLVRCGTRARKSAAGYDLVHAFVGAEGTLGVITELTVRLHPQPEEVGTATCTFATLRGAVDTVTELSHCGIQMARMEFLDELQVRACNAYSNLQLPERPTLFLEFHGSAQAVQEQIDRAADIAASHGSFGFTWATRSEDRSRLWRARHAAYFAALALRPGCSCVVADICVPISALADSVAAARAEIDREGLVAPILGHVGDGNFHVLFLVGPGDIGERERVDRVYAAMIERAHQAGGTCTGEHGIGVRKRKTLLDEFGGDTIDLMRSLKVAWDPLGIMNPGKVLLDD